MSQSKIFKTAVPSKARFDPTAGGAGAGGPKPTRKIPTKHAASATLHPGGDPRTTARAPSRTHGHAKLSDSRVASTKAIHGTGRSGHKPAPHPETKQDAVIALLRRSEGTTIAAAMAATGWQAHSVRGFFAAVVRKKLGLDLVSEKTGSRTGLSHPGRDERQSEANARQGVEAGHHIEEDCVA